MVLFFNTIFQEKLMRLFEIFLWDLFEDVVEFSVWEKRLKYNLGGDKSQVINDNWNASRTSLVLEVCFM